MICLAQKGDAIEVARIHKQEIVGGFLSSLPAAFLAKLYLAIIENDFCVVAKDNGAVIGFISGTADIKRLYSYFLKRYFFYSLVVLLPKIFNIRKIIEDIFYPAVSDIKAEFLTVAVKRKFQGQGVAREMLKLFVFEMKKRNVPVFKVLAGEELKNALKLYEKNGFTLSKEISLHKGQKSRIYIYKVI